MADTYLSELDRVLPEKIKENLEKLDSNTSLSVYKEDNSGKINFLNKKFNRNRSFKR